MDDARKTQLAVQFLSEEKDKPGVSPSKKSELNDDISSLCEPDPLSILEKEELEGYEEWLAATRSRLESLSKSEEISKPPAVPSLSEKLEKLASSSVPNRSHGVGLK